MIIFVVIAFLCIALAAACYVFAPRGLDVSDEGATLQTFVWPKEIFSRIFFDYLYVAPLLQRFQVSVTTLRRMTLILSLISSALFIAALGHHMESLGMLVNVPPVAQMALAGVLMAGAFLRYTIVSPTLGHDHINSTCGYLASALALFGCTMIGEHQFLSLCSFWGSGICIGAHFFNRLPSFAATLALTMVYILLQGDPASALIGCGFLLAGAASLLFFHFTFIQTASDWYRAVKTFLTLYKGQVDTEKVHIRYLRELAAYFKETILARRYELGGAVLLGGIIGLTETWQGAEVALCLLIGITILRFITTNASEIYGEERNIKRWLRLYVDVAVVIAAFSAVLALFGEPVAGHELSAYMILLAYLALVPIANSVVSSGHIMDLVPMMASVWVAALLLPAIYFSGQIPDTMSLELVALAYSLYGASLVYFWYIRHPFRLRTSLLKHTYPVSLGLHKEKLFFDEATGLFIENMIKTLETNGFSPKDDALSLYGVSGLVFGLGGNSMGIVQARINRERSESIQAVAGVVRDRIPEERLGHAWVLQCGELGDEMEQILLDKVGFPEPFQAIELGHSPYTGEQMIAWKPRD